MGAVLERQLTIAETTSNQGIEVVTVPSKTCLSDKARARARQLAEEYERQLLLLAILEAKREGYPLASDTNVDNARRIYESRSQIDRWARSLLAGSLLGLSGTLIGSMLYYLNFPGPAVIAALFAGIAGAWLAHPPTR